MILSLSLLNIRVDKTPTILQPVPVTRGIVASPDKPNLHSGLWKLTAILGRKPTSSRTPKTKYRSKIVGRI